MNYRIIKQGDDYKIQQKVTYKRWFRKYLPEEYKWVTLTYESYADDASGFETCEHKFRSVDEAEQFYSKHYVRHPIEVIKYL